MAEILFGGQTHSRAAAQRCVFSAVTLALIGVLVQIAVTTTRSSETLFHVQRQVAYVLASGLVGWLAYAIGYRRAVALSRSALVVLWVLLALLLLPGAAHIGGGSARWIELGSLGHLQPSELAKVVLILFFSGFAYQRRETIGSFREGFLPAMSYLGITAVLVVLEPDLGQAVFLVALSAAVLMINGLRVGHFLPCFLLGIPALYFVMREKWSYIGDRVEGFLSGGHYQVQQGLRFLAHGGPTGQPLGDGRAHLFVPEIRNDFALVAVGEHGGLIGCTLVLALFLVLLHQGLRLAGRARDAIGFSVAFGLAFMIALQAAVNVAVVVALVPPKGISLPFVSYGGSSLLVNAVAVGLLASVAKDAKDTKHQSHRGLPDPGDPLQVPGLEHRAIIGSLHTPAAPGPEGLRFLRPPSTHPSFATESVS